MDEFLHGKSLEGPLADTWGGIQEVLRSILDDEALPVTRDTAFQEIEAWDWVMHATVLLEVERAFGLCFSASAMAYLKTFGDLAELVDSKRGGRLGAGEVCC